MALVAARHRAPSLFERVDWTVLVFFAGLFISVAALRQTGLPAMALGLGAGVVADETGQLGRSDAGFGVEAVVRFAAQGVQRAMGEDRGTVEAAIPHQQVAAQADQQQGLVVAQSMQEGSEIGQVDRKKCARHSAASAPRNVASHGLVLSQFAAKFSHGPPLDSSVPARRRWNRRPW